MGMENFSLNNQKRGENLNKDKTPSSLKKNAKNLLIATGVALSAMLPNKTEAQMPKEKEPIIVTDPKDPRLEAYKDSLNLYTKTLQLRNEFFGSENGMPYPELLALQNSIKNDASFQESRKRLANPRPEKTTNMHWHGDSEIMDEFDALAIYEKPKQEVVYKPKLLGTINVHGRSIEYFSETQLNYMKAKLEAHNIILTKVGDSQNYTASRFNEKTKGWIGNQLLDEKGELNEKGQPKNPVINLEDYKF
jgi:hypothetical protein